MHCHVAVTLLLCLAVTFGHPDNADFKDDWWKGSTRCSEAIKCIPAHEHPIWHKHVKAITGLPHDQSVMDQVKRIIKERNAKSILISEDSAHEYGMVLQNLQTYAAFVSKDSYLIVQDTKLTRMIKSRHCQGLSGAELDKCWDSLKAGPGDAATTFLATNKEFAVDKEMEQLYYSQHAGGFLKKVA